MLIKNEFEVAEPVEKVWQFFDNIPQVAACLPGAELTEDLGDDKYKGTVAVRMGPVRLQFAGTADITERDEAAIAVAASAGVDASSGVLIYDPSVGDAMTDEQRKSVALEYLKAFDNKGVTSNGGSIARLAMRPRFPPTSAIVE